MVSEGVHLLAEIAGAAPEVQEQSDPTPNPVQVCIGTGWLPVLLGNLAQSKTVWNAF